MGTFSVNFELLAEGATTPPKETLLSRRELNKRSDNAAVKEMLRRKDKHRNYRVPREARPFIGWDGEGITYIEGTPQSYVLFGCSTGEYVQSKDLDTLTIFDLLMRAKAAHPHAIHVGFAFSYDVEMILKDLPDSKLRRLYADTHIRWEGYRIEYIKGKWFQVTGQYNGERTTIKIFDVFSFFSTSFVRALREYNICDSDTLDYIESGKQQRNVFTYVDIEPLIKPYWQTELRVMVDLMNKLRSLLLDANLNLSSWHGPGAIANVMLSEHDIAAHVGRETYKDNKGYWRIRPLNNGATERTFDAIQYGYAAGHFELYQMGWLHGECYKSDLNSAYPAAIAQLPDLSTGRWEHVTEYDANAKFAIWLVQYRDESEFLRTMPHPFFIRGKHSEIRYPDLAECWQWAPEVKMATELMPDRIHGIVEGYIFHSDGSEPFAWVRDCYEQRQIWKAQKVQAQIAYKLGLNSLYGKTAQRSGYRRGKEVPKYHDLAWAGWVTSYTRAELFRAIWQAWQLGVLIACETDSILTSKPLDLPFSSTELGLWDYEEYDDCIYLQNGVYFLKDKDGWAAHTRGMNPGSLTVEDAQRWLADPTKTLAGIDTRFIGGQTALRGRQADHRKWLTLPREVNPLRNGKRQHFKGTCLRCRLGLPFDGGMHDMAISPRSAHSQPHAIPWRKIAQENEWNNPADSSLFAR